VSASDLTPAPGTSWTAICNTEDIFEGMGLRFERVDHPPLAVFNVAGSFHVTDDTCSHGNASLADGWLEGDEIECPFHQGRFCVRTGLATAFPAETPIRVYPSKVEEGQVWVAFEGDKP
jgi:nitrite reductase/ring-hydroxylating ferredoxin subunit